jgi:superfamily II DNA or RNA helicase
MKHRDYQNKAIDAVFKEWEENQSTLVVLPTGCGKTHVFAGVIERMKPKRSIVIAHRGELIWQAREKIEQAVGMECSVEMAELAASTNLFSRTPVVIATVQTLCSTSGSGALVKRRMERFDPKEFGCLVIDECHHATSASYCEIINYFTGRNPDIKILGVTATPDRSDEEALGQVFKTVAFDYEILDSINDGWLVPIEQQLVHIEGLDFSQIKTTAGDLNSGELNAVLEAEGNLHGYAKASIDIIGDRRSIVFTSSVKQAETLCAIFNRHRDGMASWVCGATPKRSREGILTDFKTGKAQVVCNCGVLTEGFDSPEVQCIIMARPTKSRSLYAQMTGRSIRPLPGLVDPLETPEARREAIARSAKPSALIIDFCIAEGQLVLTDSGLVPIEKVTTAMRVWDGVDFVSHGGSVFRGEQQTIEYAGLIATADHKVWTKQGWETFGRCASEQIAITVTGLGRQEVWEVDGCYRGGNTDGEPKKLSLRSNKVRLWNSEPEGLFKSGVWSCWMSAVRSAKKLSSLALCALSKRQRQMPESKVEIFSDLRWSWDKIYVQNSVGNGILGSGQPRTSQGTESRPDKRQRKLRTWESEMGRQNDAVCQSENKKKSTAGDVARLSVEASRNKICRFDIEADAERNERRGNCEKIPRTFTKTKRRVWDILYCGPRNRFTVEGLLVSNCGNSGRHKLMCTADILGGNVSDEVVELAVRKAKESGAPVNMTKALEDAEKEVRRKIQLAKIQDAARKSKLIARVKYSTTRIDPFSALDIVPVRDRGWDSGKTLSEKQRMLLLKQSINPDEISYSQGRQVLNEMFRRWGSKLCTLKQANIIKKNRPQTDCRNLTMDAASKIISEIFNKN